MNILEKIIAHKRKEVADRKNEVTMRSLEQSIYFSTPCYSMTEYVRKPDRTGIIAEFKRRSPSKGIINADASVVETTRGYVEAGASGLSVLTDEQFFGGSREDLYLARKNNACPILRKDFTVDEFQVVEAKSLGADVILLIAAVLDPADSRKLTDLAHALGLEVLLEVHNEEELRANLEVGADLIGVNNRNLKTFEVSTDVSRQLAPLIPSDVVKVSESGISSPDVIADLRKSGFEGFLIGETFMKTSRPDVAAAEFMNRLRVVSNTRE